MDDLVSVIIVLVMFAIFANIISNAQRKKRVKQAYTFRPEQTQAAADFAKERDLKRAGYFGSKGIRLGLSLNGRTIRYAGAGHLLLVAAARTGKAFTVLVALILSLPRRYSLLVIDPKAELTCITAWFRSKIGKVYILNPFGMFPGHLKGLKQASFNPMAELNPDSPSFDSDCDKLVNSFWVEDAGHRDAHWSPSAKLLVAGVIAALRKYGKPHEQNLPTAREIITGSNGYSVEEFCRECMKVNDTYVRQKLARFAYAEPDNKEIAGIISTADTQTGFLGNEAIANSLKKSDFSFRDLKREAGTTVYVCLPLNKLDVVSQYFQMVTGCMMDSVLEEARNGKGAPVLAVIDEMAQLGYMKALQDAWGMAAGAAGLQILAVYQDLSQIVNQFEKSWQTMIQNSGVTLWFGARDAATREMISKLAGVKEVLTQNRSVNIDHRTGEPHVSDGASSVVRPVIHPHEAGELKEDEMLIFCEGVNGAVKAKRKPFLSEFRGKYRDNPYFKKSGFWSWLS